MRNQRFFSLDAMRGVAALAVVVFHIGTVMGLGTFHYAYLAVDFFFMLSGFVLTRTYERQLTDATLTAGGFMKQRAIRLYPVFAIGSLFGATMIAGQIAFHSAHAMRPPMAVIAIILNMLMLPAPSPIDLFPLNGPAWSLFFELVANIVFAIILFRLSTRWLKLVCAGTGIIFFCGMMIAGNSNLGTDWATALWGLFRVIFGFSLGMLFARYNSAVLRHRGVGAILAVASLAAILMVTLPERFDRAYDSGAVFVILPALLWIGIKRELPTFLLRTGSVLGDISYPLYAIHYPILQICTFVFVHRLHHPGMLVAIIYLASVILLSWILVWAFDAPVRAWLTRRTVYRPAIGLSGSSPE